MNYKKILFTKVDKLLKGEYSVKEFSKDYYFFYLDELPDGILTDDEFMFFGDIQEKLDWTDEDPDEVSRSYGWMNYKQYTEYVRRITEDFLQRGKYDFDKWGKIKSAILKEN